MLRDGNGVPNRALKHVPQRAVSLLAQIFNAVILTHHFPSVWKDGRVISILKPGKDPALPSSYRPISLLDTIGKLFEKILLTRILHVSERSLMRDGQFAFTPRHSTFLQLGVLLFADHIRALTGSFDSNLADVGNPQLRHLGRYLR